MNSRFATLFALALFLVVLCAAAPLAAQDAETKSPEEPASEAPDTASEGTDGATHDAARDAEAEAVEWADLTDANRLVRDGAYAEAAEILAALSEEFPEDARVLMMRGEVLLALGQVEAALPVLQNCAAVDPERVRLHFQLATALQAVGDRPAAIQAFGREIELNDDSQVKVMAHLNRYVLMEQSKDWDGAVSELEAVLALEPSRGDVYGEIASLYLRAGRLDDAAASLAAGAEEGFRSAKHMYSIGARYLKAKAYGPAADSFRATLEIDPAYADAERNLAVALDQLGENDEALQHFRRYLELRPDAPDSGEITRRIREAGGG